MADFVQLKKEWLDKYKLVPAILAKVKDVKTAATAFNTNIDAVLKISGRKIEALIEKTGLNLADLENNRETKLNSGADVVRGIFKCFCRGIAEEWITEDKKVYDWMSENIGYDRLQMGGQGGIVANVLAVAGVQKVYAHTNSLPKLQAEQFLQLENLLSFDEQGKAVPAYKIDRKTDIPLIHWIIEFDKGDSLTVGGKTFTCPKSNRFIATYDPLNLHLVMDKNFVSFAGKEKLDYMVLSGFHALTERNNGVSLSKEALPIIKAWKENGTLVHLEIASTQDIAVRRSIIKNIAPIVDSIGINEREAIDILEVIDEQKLAEECEKDTHSVCLFKALLKIKQALKAPRVQLHLFGLYLTIQDKGFVISPEANLRGMMTAATVAAGKAGTGSVNEAKNLLWAQGREVSDTGLKELEELAAYIGDEKLTKTGISCYDGYDIIAVPTILIEKPVTLVGMGDTISSLSLLCAR